MHSLLLQRHGVTTLSHGDVEQRLLAVGLVKRELGDDLVLALELGPDLNAGRDQAGIATRRPSLRVGVAQQLPAERLVPLARLRERNCPREVPRLDLRSRLA